MKNSTLLFLVKKDGEKITDVCLAMKKRGFGAGKYNGAGGKVEGDETIEEATIRETHEEFGVTARDLKKCSEINFEFPHKPEWNQTVHSFITDVWDGEPEESEEMKPEWFKVSGVPYKDMWPADFFWIPFALDGKYTTGKVIFGENNTVLSHDIKVS